jgi:hypothetical protein
MAFSRSHAERLVRKIADLTIQDVRENTSIISQNRIMLPVSADTV